MSRLAAVLALLVVGCRSSEAPPSPSVKPKPEPSDGLGPWGEDPALTPVFAMEQERRAPKLPSVDKEMARLPSEITLDRVDQGVLLCRFHVTDPPGNPWDAFAGPDLAFQLAVGHAHPIRLWGPENHSNAYVSVPRFSFARGDVLHIDGWDRDVSSDTYIGGGTVTFDGKLPVRFESQWMTVECTALTHEQAEEVARPMLAAIDADLDLLEKERPDEKRADLGGEPGIENTLKGMFHGGGSTPLRYAAGALGWEDPAIQQRLSRLRTFDDRWRTARAELVRTIAGTLPARGATVQLGDGASLRVADVTCAREACTILVEGNALPPLPTPSVRDCFPFDVGVLRSDGDSSPVQCGAPIPTDGGAPSRIRFVIPQRVNTPARSYVDREARDTHGRLLLLEVTVAADAPPVRLRLDPG
jgi:hypothetical protein